MKIFVKRNFFKYNDEIYSKDILLNINDVCSCIHNIEYQVCTNINKNDFDFHNEKMNIYLISRHMETDVDYDWDEFPIINYYEEETFIPIYYCPICGQKLEIIIDENIDKTNEIQPLMDELSLLKTKYNSSKVMNKKYEIRNKILEIMNN